MTFISKEMRQKYLDELRSERPCCICGHGVPIYMASTIESKPVHSRCLFESERQADVEDFP